MKRTTRVVVVCALAVGIFSITGCSISVGSMGQRSSSRATLEPVPVTGSVSPASPASSPPTVTADGATYLALVAPVNAAATALDNAISGSTTTLTPQALRALIDAYATSLRTFDGHLRSDTWPRTAEPDIATLAAMNDVLVEGLETCEWALQSPSAADVNEVVQTLQPNGPGDATDLAAAARVRADLGLPPPAAPQATLND